jgi:peptide/nickel transport system permease protein
MQTEPATGSPNGVITEFRPVASPGWVMQAFRRFRRHRLGQAGVLMLFVIISVGVIVPFVTPYQPNKVILMERLQPPSKSHILGTDDFGRDVFTRLVYGIRVSLSVGFSAVIFNTIIGVTLGSIAGYYRGWVDAVIMRFTDVVMCFPTLIAMLIMVAVLRPSILNLVVIIGLFGWESKCRLVRGQLLSLREQQFVEAAHCLGATAPRIIVRHLVPNALAPVIVAVTFSVGGAILSEASLSFLGVGIQSPTASLGNMLKLASNLTSLLTMPWLWLPPGLTIMATVLAINFAGDALRDALDPRSLAR